MSRYQQTEARIGRVTLVLGCVVGVAAGFMYSFRVGAGVVIGAGLATLNYRWLASALDAVATASTAQAGFAQARVPIGSYAKLVARYLLIGALVYAIFMGFHVPIVSMLVGMCALGAATILASLYEIFEPGTKLNGQ